MTNATTQFKIPVLKILFGSISTFWWNKGYYSKKLALPTLLLTIIWAVNILFFGQLGQANQFGFWALKFGYIIALSIFSITCHRLILMENDDDSINISFKKRDLKFTLWFIAMALIFNVVRIAPFVSLNHIADMAQKEISDYYLYLISSIPGIYIMGRLCMVFPATAIDVRTSLKSSWKATRKNGWRIVAIVVLYPVLISAIIALISRNEATLIERTVTALLYYLGIALEIFALSLTYKELTAHQKD